MLFKNWSTIQVNKSHFTITILQDSLQLSAVYEEIVSLIPWCISAFNIFWESGLARLVDWNPLKSLIRGCNCVPHQVHVRVSGLSTCKELEKGVS